MNIILYYIFAGAAILFSSFINVYAWEYHGWVIRAIAFIVSVVGGVGVMSLKEFLDESIPKNKKAKREFQEELEKKKQPTQSGIDEYL